MRVTGAPDGYTAVKLGDANDTVKIGGSHDVIVLGTGTDMVSGTQGMSFISTGAGNDTISVGGSGNHIDAGGGNNTIIGGSGHDTFVLPKASQGFDAISAFSETNGDVLDLHAALGATSWNDKAKTLGNYLKVTDSGGNTNLAIAPTGSGAGTAIATLNGVNYGLPGLLSQHSLLT